MMARGEWRFIAEPYLAAVAISVVSGLSACVFSPSRHTHAPAPALAMASTMASRVRATLAFPVRAARATTSWRLVRAPASRRLGAFLGPLPRRRGFTSAASPSDATASPSDPETTPESYLDVASRPSRFEESSWGPPETAEVLLQSMRIQWSHGYPHTPRGYPRLTHGFHEYPAGMQAAAADRILDVLPGDSLLDPFMGSGTSLVVGMTRGMTTFGVDVSPLASFVAAHRAWRPKHGDSTLEAMRAAAAAVVVGVDDAAKALTDEYEASRSGVADADADPGVRGGGGGGAVPRDWRPAQRALASVVDSALVGDAEEGVAGALCFCLSVALQRSQKGRGKRRPYKRRRKKAAAAIAAAESSATQGQRDAAEAFARVVDEYCDRVGELIAATPEGTPRATTYNEDVRETTLPRLVDAVLTSPPYPGVYDYLSFARKVRAGSGAATAASGTATTSERSNSSARSESSSRDIVPGGEGYLRTVVPEDRSWPDAWTSGEIGARRALRADPRAFKDAWQREQEGWLGTVARSLTPGGRAAVMVGDGANVNTERSILDAGERVGLRGVAGATMALTHNMSDGTVWNAARREHLILLEKPAV